jgi:hypothetical protein
MKKSLKNQYKIIEKLIEKSMKNHEKLSCDLTHKDKKNNNSGVSLMLFFKLLALYSICLLALSNYIIFLLYSQKRKTLISYE